MADSARQEKVARLIQREMGEIFQREAQAKLRNMIISVTVVRISPDLAVAKVYLSIFPSEKAKDIMTEVKDLTSYFRNALGIRVKQQLRIVPELHFYLDDSLDYIQHIDNILKDI